MTADTLAGLREEVAKALWERFGAYKIDFAMLGTTQHERYMQAADAAIARVLAFAAEQCTPSKPLLDMGGPDEIALVKTEMRHLAERLTELATAARGA